MGRLLQSGSVNSFNTYNDYTALFERPGVKGSLVLATGTQDRHDGQLHAYGSLPEQSLAYGAIATYFDNDGWRDTNGKQFKDLSAIVKWDATLSDSFLFSASRSKLRRARLVDMTTPAGIVNVRTIIQNM